MRKYKQVLLLSLILTSVDEAALKKIDLSPSKNPIVITDGYSSGNASFCHFGMCSGTMPSSYQMQQCASSGSCS
ncbi:hypothetical protein GBAR_LOCUS24881, partial [Geodia barretti]